MPKNTKQPFRTSMELDSDVRDDMTKLSKIEAKKIGIPHMPNKTWLARVVKREKEKAIASGEWNK